MEHFWSSREGASFPAHGRSALQGLEGSVLDLAMLLHGR